MQPIRVLLADDHAVVRFMLRDLIEDDETCVVCAEATNGEEALRFADQYRPEVAVIDISMPVMDGLEATRQISARLPDTAVLILTLHGAHHSADLARAAGARGFLRKCDVANHLTAAIHMVRDTSGYVSAEAILAARSRAREFGDE